MYPSLLGLCETRWTPSGVSIPAWSVRDHMDTVRTREIGNRRNNSVLSRREEEGSPYTEGVSLMLTKEAQRTPTR